MILPLLLAVQTAAAAQPAPAAPIPEAGPSVPTVPTKKDTKELRKELRKLGLPGGMAEPIEASAVIDQVMLAPLFHKSFVCMEHPDGQLSGAGDAIGADCMVVGGIKGMTGFQSFFRTNGRTNADWYGWRAEVHAPFDGEVIAVVINPVTNRPGKMGKPPASGIVFRREDGVNVVYGHVMEPRVKKGDKVKAGQVVALDGNNGMARAPHVHVGAWKGKTPFQIRWDLKAEGQVPSLVGG